jgi:4-amino-4-deoxy-L-arabinose transferase-like glycosyltransferase
MLSARNFRPYFLPCITIAAIVVTLYLSAPKAEDFGWPDAATFPLNGELIRDFIASGFHQSPMAFATDWFRRYPAVTLSLYPPIFPVVEAFAFTVFGFSHAVAQATVAAFTALAAYATYRIASTAVTRPEAAACVLMVFAAPAVLFWSRQVMLELPFLAFLLLASFFLLRYLATNKPRTLFMAIFWLLCGVYTKQTAIFAAPAFAITLIADQGWRVLARRHVWYAAVFGMAGLVPLAVFTLFAAPETMDIALGQGIAAGSDGPGRLYGILSQAQAYIGAMPEVVGWPALLPAACYAVVAAVSGWRSAGEQRLGLLMAAWFVTDFVFVCLTGHFERRYAIGLAIPCACASVLLIARLPGPLVRPWLAMGAAAVLFLAVITTHRVNLTTGFDKVAAYLIDHSQQDDVVWFQARDSQNMAFSLRSHSERPKLFLLRAEKFLTSYHIVREWGISDRNWTTGQLADLADSNHIKFVVLQPEFWSDLPSMARMRDFIESGRFTQVAEFPITSDSTDHRTTLKIFVRNN